MKSYNTLHGAVTGDEPDDFEPSFAFSATLRIFSEAGLDFAKIGSVLKLQPTNTRRRGDRISARSSPSKYDVWMYSPPVSEELELHHHIDALWQALKPHVEFLTQLKTRGKVDVFLGYSTNMDHSGLSIPYRSLEMFIALEVDLGVSIVVVPEV